MGLWSKITLSDSDPSTEAQYRQHQAKGFKEMQLATFFYFCVSVVLGLYTAFNHYFEARYLLLGALVAVFPAMMSLISFSKNEYEIGPAITAAAPPGATRTPTQRTQTPFVGNHLPLHQYLHHQETVVSSLPLPLPLPPPPPSSSSASAIPLSSFPPTASVPAAGPSSSSSSSSSSSPPGRPADLDPEQQALDPNEEESGLAGGGLKPRLDLMGMLGKKGAQYSPLLDVEDGMSYYSSASSSPLSPTPTKPPKLWSVFIRCCGGQANFSLGLWNALGALGYLTMSLSLLLEQLLCLWEEEGNVPQSCNPILQHTMPPHLVLFMTAAPLTFGVLNINWVLIGGVHIILIVVQFCLFAPLLDQYNLWLLSFLQVMWMAYCSLTLRKGEIMKRTEFADRGKSNKQLSSLNEARKSAQDAHDQKRDFVNYIFHEVRVQFHNLAQGLDLVFQTKANRSEEELETLFGMGSAADLMSRMLNGVLDLAKLEDGTFVPKKVPFDLLKLTREITRTFQTTAKSKSINLSIDESHSSLRQLEGSLIRWDPLRYQEILGNFLSNALKFTNAQGKVTVKCHVVSPTDEDRENIPLNHIIIRTIVIDTGVGISLSDQRKLFKPFIQGNSSAVANNPTRGTGLGLAICKRLCHHCDFRSEDKKGSEFWFDIVVDLVQSLNAQPTTTSSVLESKGYYFTTCSLYDLQSINKPQAQKILSGKKVLIVDDTDQRFTMKNLERLGCISVVHVMSGEAGAEKCNEQHFDLVIMDHNLRGKGSTDKFLNGVQATSVIKSAHPKIVILGLSGTMDAALSEQWIRAGASKVLTKPATQQQLQEKLQGLF